MLSRRKALIAVALALLVLGFGAQGSQGDSSWTQQFPLEGDELSSTGRNPYFVLEPGYRMVLQQGSERLTITVLAETRKVNGVETRVVEERETKDGALVEVSRNFFAISKRTNSVFYFGEDVDMYKDGKITSHEGAWLAGVGGAKPGLMMPGLPLVGGRYYQEIAPGVAMDRARILKVTGTLDTPAGHFANVLETEETTPLEPGQREIKRYAPGVGLIQDAGLKLVSFGRI
jgi:hypothetical protein